MLDSRKLHYSPFFDKRSEKQSFHYGSSGPLLLATSPLGQKYVIKHTYPHNAANEYVASWLATQIGVLAPRAELLTPNSHFCSDYAVAIEYFDSLTIPDNEVIANCKSDLIALYALNVLVEQEDIIQYYQSGKRIVPVDFSECFYLDYDIMPRLLKLSAAKDELFYYWSKNCLRLFEHRIATEKFCLPETAKELHIDSTEMTAGMIKVAKRVLKIKDSDIDDMTDELCNLYPYEIAFYYDLYIHAMQDSMKKF